MSDRFPDPDGPPDEPTKAKAKANGKAPTTKAKPTKPKASPRRSSLEVALADTFRSIALGIGFVNRDDAAVIGQQADPLAAALVKLSKTNDRVKYVLEVMVSGSAWGEVVGILLMGIALPIAQNHGYRFPWEESPLSLVPDAGDPAGLFDALRQKEAPAAGADDDSA